MEVWNTWICLLDDWTSNDFIHGKLLLQLSTELVEASFLYHSDDLLHYSFELHEIYWWWMVTVSFIFTIAFGFFIGCLIEK
ncbi:MAG: hypothetical protein KAT65_21480 [Methanophagales archaeon]|jgi:hypothetical protein|nr:hypothetical protein [Methanophagales archaeon]